MTVWGFIFALCLFEFHPEAAQSKYRWLYMLCAISCFAASVMSQSRSTLLGLIAALVILLFRKRRLLMVTIAVIIFFAMSMPVKQRFIDSKYYNIRIGLFYYTLEMIKDYPLTGVGFSLDTYRDSRVVDTKKYMARVPKAYQNPVHPYLWPHNLILNVMVRTGVVGLALYLFFIAAVIRMAVRLARAGNSAFIRNWGLCLLAALIMYLFKAMFDPVFTHFCDMVFYTSIAMIAVLWRLDRQHPKETPVRSV